MDLHRSIERITTKEDLAQSIEQLRQDLADNPDEWENMSLDAYLEAMAAWLHDMDGYYRNQGLALPTAPTWQTIGEILLAAKMYE